MALLDGHRALVTGGVALNLDGVFHGFKAAAPRIRVNAVSRG